MFFAKPDAEAPASQYTLSVAIRKSIRNIQAYGYARNLHTVGMVARGSLAWRRGDFFPYTVLGGFGSKICFPLPYDAPEFRILPNIDFSRFGAFSPLTLPDNPRTFTGRNRGFLARSRAIQFDTFDKRESIPGGRAKKRKNPPLLPSENSEGEQIMKCSVVFFALTPRSVHASPYLGG